MKTIPSLLVALSLVLPAMAQFRPPPSGGGSSSTTSTNLSGNALVQVTNIVNGALVNSNAQWIGLQNGVGINLSVSNAFNQTNAAIGGGSLDNYHRMEDTNGLFRELYSFGDNKGATLYSWENDVDTNRWSVAYHGSGATPLWLGRNGNTSFGVTGKRSTNNASVTNASWINTAGAVTNYGGTFDVNGNPYLTGTVASVTSGFIPLQGGAANALTSTNGTNIGTSIFPAKDGVLARVYSTNTSRSPFNASIQANDGTNSVFCFGYNLVNGGALEDGTKSGIGWGIEPAWWNGGAYMNEQHWYYNSPFLGQTRPISFTVNTNHDYDTGTMLHHASTHIWYGGLTNTVACMQLTKSSWTFTPEDGSGFQIQIDSANGLRNSSGTTQDFEIQSWRNLYLLYTANLYIGSNAATQSRFNAGELYLGGQNLYFGGAAAGTVALHNIGSDTVRLEDSASSAAVGSIQSSNVIATGKIGIGTTSPGYKLHVVGDAYIPTNAAPFTVTTPTATTLVTNLNQRGILILKLAFDDVTGGIPSCTIVSTNLLSTNSFGVLSPTLSGLTLVGTVTITNDYSYPLQTNCVLKITDTSSGGAAVRVVQTMVFEQ